ncbi:MAG TPA: hypothetical protein VMZ50_05420 [Phycisphaerae bacterium]|nr:hypothetical protein [Phycisphaerae bacterium]
MRASGYNTRNEAREERKRMKLAAGIMAERFPSVASIVVTMNYRRERCSAVLRTLTFNPDSSAFFRFSCLGEGCGDGGLDLTRVIHQMIKNRAASAKGALNCDNKDPEIIHGDVDYKVNITYA